MNPIKELKSFKKRFDKKLLDFLNAEEEKAEKIDPGLVVLIKEIKDFVEAGGKRLRPAFLYYGYKASGGREEIFWRPCMALELFHSFALIHDDIMDDSPLRRGKPTVYKKLGPSTALLVGDLALVLADEAFGNQRGQTLKFWNLLKKETIYGQTLDSNGKVPKVQSVIYLRGVKRLLSKQVLKIMEYKSGRYTVVRPLQVGASLAGVDKKTLKALENYGLKVGLAFQIQDDILGMFGSEKKLGKPVDSDLKEGKKTLLFVKTLEKLKGKEREKFFKIWGNKKTTNKDLQWIRDLMKKTGALNFCQKMKKRLVKQAKMAISKYPFEKEAEEFLVGIANYIIEREL